MALDCALHFKVLAHTCTVAILGFPCQNIPLLGGSGEVKAWAFYFVACSAFAPLRATLSSTRAGLVAEGFLVVL